MHGGLSTQNTEIGCHWGSIKMFTPTFFVGKKYKQVGPTPESNSNLKCILQSTCFRIQTQNGKIQTNFGPDFKGNSD